MNSAVYNIDLAELFSLHRLSCFVFQNAASIIAHILSVVTLDGVCIFLLLFCFELVMFTGLLYIWP